MISCGNGNTTDLAWIVRVKSHQLCVCLAGCLPFNNGQRTNELELTERNIDEREIAQTGDGRKGAD